MSKDEAGGGHLDRKNLQRMGLDLWLCEENRSILYANKTKRDRCFKCGAKRDWLETKEEVRLRSSYPGWLVFDSDWA